MARLTVERCKFDHFELVAIASERTKQLISGVLPTVAKGNDKLTVVALREIEKDNIDIEKIRKSLITKYQLRGTHDNLEEETQESNSESGENEDYTSNEHDFGGSFEDLNVEEFDNDNIFSDDINEDEDKIIR